MQVRRVGLLEETRVLLFSPLLHLKGALRAQTGQLTLPQPDASQPVREKRCRDAEIDRKERKTYNSTSAIQTQLQDETIVWPTDGVQKDTGGRAHFAWEREREREKKRAISLQSRASVSLQRQWRQNKYYFWMFHYLFLWKKGAKAACVGIRCGRASCCDSLHSHSMSAVQSQAAIG